MKTGQEGRRVRCIRGLERTIELHREEVYSGLVSRMSIAAARNGIFEKRGCERWRSPRWWTELRALDGWLHGKLGMSKAELDVRFNLRELRLLREGDAPCRHKYSQQDMRAGERLSRRGLLVFGACPHAPRRGRHSHFSITELGRAALRRRAEIEGGCRFVLTQFGPITFTSASTRLRAERRRERARQP
jgi:hypothetical protein